MIILKEIKTNILQKKFLFLILAANFVLHVAGITWGLPNRESWAIDAVVPNGMLTGLAKGFSFGYSWQYPMVHLVILSALCLPVLAAACINVTLNNSWDAVISLLKGMKGMDAYDIMLGFDSLINIDLYATAMMVIARAVTVLMSLGIVYYVYRIGRELFSERAALFSAAVLTFNMSFTFYSHFENVDVPYMFWAVISLYHLVRIIKYDLRGDYIKCAVFTALSYGTKDQAYAVFILPFIVYLIIVPLLRELKLKVLIRKNLLIFVAVSVLSFVIVENLVLNWNGFLTRVSDMTGFNSKAYMPYIGDISGYLILIKDIINVFANYAMSLPFALLSAAGIILLFLRYKKESPFFHDRLLFFYAILSFTVFFNLVAMRAEMRFVLPQSVFASFYAGYFLSFTRGIMRRKLKPVFIVLFSALCIYGFYYAVTVDVNLLSDVRYEVTGWMKNSINPGSDMERYEGYAYLPQFPGNIREYRIKKNFSEIESRKPDYIILSSSFYVRFLENGDELSSGYKIPEQTAGYRDSEQGAHIRNLMAGRLNYREKIRFCHKLKWFRKIFVPDHIIVFERIAGY